MINAMTYSFIGLKSTFLTYVMFLHFNEMSILKKIGYVTNTFDQVIRNKTQAFVFNIRRGLDSPDKFGLHVSCP